MRSTAKKQRVIESGKSRTEIVGRGRLLELRNISSLEVLCRLNRLLHLTANFRYIIT